MKNGSPYHFHVGRADEAYHLVERWHYSHRVPAAVQFVGTMHEDGGLFGNLGPAVAAVLFTIPPTRWSESVLELARLVRRDDAILPLTRLIGLSVKELRRLGHDLLVSFADRTQGHTGYIYQASSWRYHGCRDAAMDGVLVNGRFVPGRAANHSWGTRSPEKLRLLMPTMRVDAHYDAGKHLYWRALSRHGEEKASRLGLANNPYPKGNVTMPIAVSR